MKNKLIYIAVAGVLMVVLSCSKNVLNETPESFLSPDNSYQDYAGFQSAVIGLYPFLRSEDYWSDNFQCYNMVYGTDQATWAETAPNNTVFIYYDQINSSNVVSDQYWRWGFRLIQQANVIISRADNPEISWTPLQKNAVVAEARWVRAYVYNKLVNLFNGVPISNEEITSPKLDFTRSSRDSVLNFIHSDATFATQHLPDVPPAVGRVSKAAAYQLLSLVNIELKRYGEAITAASWIIDNPNYRLMTERFGVAASRPGDVFSDLFKDGSPNDPQNRETIFAVQFQYGTPGTSGSGSNTHGNNWLRAWGPFYSRIPGFALPPNGADSLGRGVGWVKPTRYLDSIIWSGPLELTDMRNSPYNIRRTWYYNDVTSPLYGQQYMGSTDSSSYIYPMFRKIEGVVPDNGTGRTYTDRYKMRVAETYLLRAEAYLGNSDMINAAKDINVVRARANAALIEPSDVTIDFILDERSRELAIEESRRTTLNRLNLLYDRVKKYGPVESQRTVQPYHNWLPIPQSAIDANTGAVLVQNEGY